jgi:uncharacterized coiled-coil protein SlyX
MDIRPFIPLLPLPLRGVAASLLDRLETLEHHVSTQRADAEAMARALADAHRRINLLEARLKPL